MIPLNVFLDERFPELVTKLRAAFIAHHTRLHATGRTAEIQSQVDWDNEFYDFLPEYDAVAQEEPLLAFYRGQASDHRGRALVEILRQDDQWWEQTHDFIQWVFPNRTKSAFNSAAPVLTSRDVEAFHEEPFLLRRASQAYTRFYLFLDLCNVDEKARFKPHWLTPLNHNHKRITRVLHFLREVKIEAHLADLCRALKILYTQYPEAITMQTYSYWIEASGGALDWPT